MDMLNEYNSSDDDSSEDGNSNRKPQTKVTKPSTKARVPTAAKLSKNGKKILSLTSVLPKHILDQLTKSQARGTRMDDDEDSDDSDSDGENVSKKRSSNTNNTNNKQPTPAPSKSPSSASAPDTGLFSSMLQELSSTKIGQGNKQAADASKNPADPTKSTKPKSSFTLGSAFITSTTETIVRKRASSAKAIVRDIHHEAPTKKPTTNDSGSSSSSDDDSDSDNESPATVAPTTKVKPKNAPVPRPPTSSFRSSVAVKAAPRSSVPLPPPPAPASSSYQPQYQASHYAAPAIPVSSYSTTKKAVNPKKARKRQMEAMLRQGNLSAVQSDVSLQAPSQQYQQPESVQQQQQQENHGIRAASVGLYNVKTGAADANNDDTKRSKTNQLTHLVANAAALEAARMQNPNNSSKAMKTQRASAKRKYGW